MTPTDKKPLFYLLGTPFFVDLSVLFSFFGVFAVVVWLTGRKSPTRPWPARLRQGSFAAITYLLGDVIHYCGHIISSKQAQAPMDGVHLKAPMPQSIYLNNNISPRTHQMRAIGGPIASSGAGLLALALRPLFAANSIMRKFLTTFAIGQAIFGPGAFIPLPPVDGGALLKWELVEQGETPDRADEIVQKTSLLFFGAATLAGGFFLLRKRLNQA